MYNDRNKTMDGFMAKAVTHLRLQWFARLRHNPKVHFRRPPFYQLLAGMIVLFSNNRSNFVVPKKSKKVGSFQYHKNERNDKEEKDFFPGKEAKSTEARGNGFFAILRLTAETETKVNLLKALLSFRT